MYVMKSCLVLFCVEMAILLTTYKYIINSYFELGETEIILVHIMWVYQRL